MSLRIMIVDDEECIRDSLAIYFRGKGYDVITAVHPVACNGIDNRLCNSETVCADILLIDQWMPVMNGIDYLSHRAEWGCRSTGQHKALMSASLNEEIRTRAEGLGCKIFQKPVRLDEIDQWIAEIE